MEKTYTYVSVLCSNYLALFCVLMHHRIPFEWHSKHRGCGRCYADFTLDLEHNPPLDELLDEVEQIESSRGKNTQITIISTYGY